MTDKREIKPFEELDFTNLQDLQDAGETAFLGILEMAKAQSKDYKTMLQEVLDGSTRHTLSQIAKLIQDKKGVGFVQALGQIQRDGLTDSIKDIPEAVETLAKSETFLVSILLASSKFQVQVSEKIVERLEELVRIEQEQQAQTSKAANKKVKEWNHPDILGVVADRMSEQLARYFGGKIEPNETDEQGFALLPTSLKGNKKASRIGLKTFPPEEKLAYFADHSSVIPLLENIAATRNEIKAKAFVATLALAERENDPTEFFIPLGALMTLLGYDPKNTTRSQYWRRVAEVTRYMTLDLPLQVVSLMATIPGRKKPLYVESHLMQLPDVLFEQQMLPNITESMWDSVKDNESPDAVIERLRKSGLKGFTVGFKASVLEVLGIVPGEDGRGRAIEKIPSDFFKLKERSWWLGYHIAFLRRWSKETEPKNGEILLETLDRHGYIDRWTRKNGKTDWKAAVKDWWEDVGKLVDIGMLDDPGVRIYQQNGTGWHDVSTAISLKFDDSTTRISREMLGELRALYAIPETRLKELEGSRKRSKTLKAAEKRARDANMARSNARPSTEK